MHANTHCPLMNGDRLIRGALGSKTQLGRVDRGKRIGRAAISERSRRSEDFRTLGERADDRLDAPGNAAEPSEGMGWNLSDG